MGSGCTLRTNIYFSHKNFKTKDEVIDEIELNESIIRNCEKDLMMLVTMTEPAKFWRESEAEVGETPWIWMQNEAQRNIESIKECQSELDKLKTLLYCWDECHNKDGNAIEPPQGSNYSDSYFWGDWIKSVYPDGEVAHDPQEILKRNWGVDTSKDYEFDPNEIPF